MNGGSDAEAVRSAELAAGRLFRTYYQHCLRSDTDTLFHALTAMHSLNDRLRGAVRSDLHEIDEFLALKVLRNFAHHQDEFRANVRFIPMPAYSDLPVLCIVRRDQVDRAIDNVDKRWRDRSRKSCIDKFHWYGEAVNINPCLFNCMVHIYELLMRLDVMPPENDVSSFRDSYENETESGHTHFVDGRLASRAGSLTAVLLDVAAQIAPP